MLQKILIIGFGYIAQNLSSILADKNIAISATTRSPNTMDAWKNTPINLIQYNINAAPLDTSKYDFILITTPPNIDKTDPGLALIRQQLIQNQGQTKWIAYLSSTSIYGDHQGQWVDEYSKPINPGERGKSRIQIENNWLSLFDEFNLPIHIFRLSGFYGPNRNSLSRILNGKTTSIIKEGHIFSRIHVDDACCALYKSMENPTPGEIYNLADNVPCPPELVDEYAVQLLGKPPLTKIPIKEANLSPTAREFYQGSKKVCNKKIKQRLDFQLMYPSYKEGLLSLYEKLPSNT